MSSNIVNLPVKTKLVCSDCGAAGQGSCHCGAPYVRPGLRAEAAIAANPKKSDRAIADEIGVGNKTVSRARTRTVSGDTVAERTGKDGKVRTVPSRKPHPIAAEVPLQTRVDTMVRNLDSAISPWIEKVENCIANHLNELASEKNELGQTGKECLMQALRVWADRLLRLAQAIDGR